MLMHWGFIPNTQMQDVLMGKYTVQVPNEDGSPPSEVADKGVAVIMLGVRNNQCVLLPLLRLICLELLLKWHTHSALGMFGSGAKEISQFFTAMMRNLHDDKESGCTSFITPATASPSQTLGYKLTIKTVLGASYYRSANERLTVGDAEG
jgi:hypothetical protein